MSRYCQHTSEAMAAACVHTPDIIQETTLANYCVGDERMEHLLEAQHWALALVNDIQKAIQAELMARPQSARVITERARDGKPTIKVVEGV